MKKIVIKRGELIFLALFLIMQLTNVRSDNGLTISDISYLPENPFEGEDIEVFCNITTSSIIEAVELSYNYDSCG